MAYVTMARQWGINFDSINIIPANVEYDDDGNIVAITKEDFKTFSLTNPYAIACERFFPVHTATDSKTIRNLSKLIEEIYPGLQLDSKAQTVQLSKDYVMSKLVKVTAGKYTLKLDSNFDDNEKSLLNKEVTFNTKEEMEKFVEEQYIPKMNESFSSELRNFAKDLRVISGSSKTDRSKIDDLIESARGMTKDKRKQE